MNTAARLIPMLRAFEASETARLSSLVPIPLPAAANGATQFVAMESWSRHGRAFSSKGSSVPPVPDESEDEVAREWIMDSVQDAALPVVVSVGINYGQESGPRTPYRPFSTWLNGILDSAPGMRTAAHLAMSACARNGPAWFAAGAQAGSFALPANPADFILIAANASPFITHRRWGSHSVAERAALLGCTPGIGHLSRLEATLASSVDLWIFHGKEFVYPMLPLLLSATKASDWLRCFNLSALGSAGMRVAGKRHSHPDHALYR